ncbi:endothelin-converting enzyme 2 isoform X2 [Episyrphus balteatus]|uniref:endothelin-converting enzyme 2 isoform X2 n=1 Tax=Episyrphus balteatus TaxID=286459 RepID=UPI002486437B|nr:endothelin-converting enzyme 2 isoform X2 [Episyrphus balteatus]
MDTRSRVWTTNGEHSSNNPDVISVHRSAANSITRSALKDPRLNPDFIGVQSKFRRKYYYKIIVALLILLIIILLTTVIILACFKNFNFSGAYSKIDTCKSKECLRASANLLYSMDLTVDPCEDFYKFSCGNWENDHPKLDSLSSNDWFREAQAKTTRIVREFLKSDINETEPNAVNKSKLMFQACMDLDLLDELNLAPLMRYLKVFQLPRIPPALNITLPAENKEEDPEFNWIATLVQIKIHLGMDVIYGFDIFPDYYNRTVNKIAIGTPESESELPFNDYSHKLMTKAKHKIIASMKEDDDTEDDDEEDDKDSTVSEGLSSFVTYVKKVITVIAIYLYPEINSEEFQVAAGELTMDTIKMMKHFYKLQEEAENTTKKSVNPLEDLVFLTIEELQNQTDNLIDSNSLPIWESYVQLMMESNKRFKASEEKILTSHADLLYLQKVSEYLIDISQHRLQFYLWLDVVLELIAHTNSALRHLYSENIQSLTQTEGSTSRSMYCANGISNLMGMAVSFSLANQEFFTNSLPRVQEMLNLIREAFNDLVRTTSWMDSQTKEATIQKSAAVKSLIGFPDWILDKHLLDEFYADVNVSRKTHLDNLINVVAWQMRSKINAFQDVSDGDWKLSPSFVNAFFEFNTNTITVPIAILQYPFYNLGLEALNYGAIGSILGHELTHGFDDSGRMFDKTGNMRQWWSNNTIQEYINRTECFVEQYGQYQLPDIGEYVDGELTLGENIADNGGMREAFYAYKKYVRKTGMENKLSGMEKFSHEQLFFISFGNLWCETLTPAASRHVLEDVHCPGSIRLKGVLSNSEEFAKTFKCKRGSGMFPDNNKCRIW